MKSTPKKKPPVKARKMWQLKTRKIEGSENYTSAKKEYTDQVPIWTLPRTGEGYDVLRVQAGEAIQRWLNGYALPAKYPTVADAALASIGITPPTK